MIKEDILEFVDQNLPEQKVDLAQKVDTAANEALKR